MMKPTVELAALWRFPTPHILELSNGTTAWIYDLPGQHIAAFELVLPVPLEREPRGLEGVATIALNSVDEGTVTHPDGRIAELLELQGASLHGVSGLSSTRLGGDAPAHRLPEVLRLLTEIVSTPAYAEEDVAHHVALQVAAHDSRQASPGAVAKQAFRAAFFGDDTRDGRPAAGTPETLATIGRDDVLAWHGQHWVPAGATLVLAGDLADLDVEDALGALTGWTGGQAPAPRREAPSREPRVVIADMPEAVQATVQVGALTPGRRHPDWAALKLGVHAMAGAFASRLNLELRERRGLTYGVQGSLGARRTDGQLSVGGSFRTEVAAEAVTTLLGGLAAGEPFSESEVTDARQFLLGVAPLANETAADIARQAAVLASAGEDPGFVNEHFEALELPDAQAVTDAFRTHVRPDAVTIAISGRAEELAPALTAAGLNPEVVPRTA